jgi:regulator of protease activity HflC (stomatin/prohibitin superfamily)
VFCAGGTAAGPVVGGLTGIDMTRVREGGVLDEATGKWGIRVNRVELKAIDPPKSIIDAMEKQLRAERDKRAAVLTAEGLRQSQILTAEGAKQSAILTAEGQARAQVLLADGQAKAIDTVFTAIHQAARTRNYWPTNTFRCCPRSPKAAVVRCG